MAMDKIVLISNPGSESRKYSLYNGTELLLELHFERVGKDIICRANEAEQTVNISHVSFAATVLGELITTHLPELKLKEITNIGLRIVAPSSFFQEDHILTSTVVKQLEELQKSAPLHIGATLSEFRLLQKEFPHAIFYGISDSAFLASKPDKAMYYGLPYADAKKNDIKRFGFHGLSLYSVVKQLKQQSKLPERVIVCHLGGGASVAAVKNGKVVDSSMGYSPLEGVMMATRSGSVDILAFDAVAEILKLQGTKRYEYLNSQSGLLGVSGISSDVRELLEQESSTPRAKLALEMYIYKIQQAIGAMAAAMNGADALVFTGTIGYRSVIVRRRICQQLLYLGFVLDISANTKPKFDGGVATVSESRNPARIYVVKSDESATMLARIKKLKS